ncbi:MAG: flagellar hook-length control protein FliK [Paracoccaceae bacterium]
MQPAAITGVIPAGDFLAQIPSAIEDDAKGIDPVFGDIMSEQAAKPEEEIGDDPSATSCWAAIAHPATTLPNDPSLSAAGKAIVTAAVKSPGATDTHMAPADAIADPPENTADGTAPASDIPVTLTAYKGEMSSPAVAPSIAQQAIEAQLGSDTPGQGQETGIGGAQNDASGGNSAQDDMSDSENGQKGTAETSASAARNRNPSIAGAEATAAFAVEVSAAPSVALPATADTHPGSPPALSGADGMTTGFQTEQIVDGIVTRASDRIDIALTPDDLGRLHLSMTEENGQLRVAMAAERPETLDLMRRTADLLALDLRAAGYDDVVFTFEGGGSQDGHQDPPVAYPQDRSASASQHTPAPIHVPDKPPRHNRADMPGSIDLRF